MNIKALSFLLIMAIAFSTPIYADSKEHKEKDKDKVEWSEVPPKAQKTITQHAAGGKVFSVKKEKMVLMTENKKKKTVIYLAGVKKKDGKEFWVIADKDGTFIDIDRPDTESMLEEDVDNEKRERRKKENKSN